MTSEDGVGAAVAEVPGLGRPDPEAYRRKACPLLTVAAMLRPAAPGEEGVMVAKSCLGPDCAWYTPIAQDGKIVDGHCCVPLLTSAMSTINSNIVTAITPRSQIQAPNGQHKNIKR